MRTEGEMHELVVAKVAAHRRRAVLASAGGGVAAVLLLVAVVAGAASGPRDSVEAGEGDPTTTTEATTTTTTTEAPDETWPSTSTTAPAPETTATPQPPSTTEAPPPAAPPSTTEPPPTSTTTTPAGPSSTVLTGADGDLAVTATVTTDPGRPGLVTVRVQMADPTGTMVDGEWRFGPGAIIGPQNGDAAAFGGFLGDVVASCNGVPEEPEMEPGSLDATHMGTLPSGEHEIYVTAVTGWCGAREDSVRLRTTVVVP